MAKNKPETAYQGALHRTIPKKHTDVAVTTSNGTQSLSVFLGQWIWLRAISADVTLRLGSSIANVGEGYVLGTADGQQEFYVDPDDDATLNHRAGGNATLRILHD